MVLYVSLYLKILNFLVIKDCLFKVVYHPLSDYNIMYYVHLGQVWYIPYLLHGAIRENLISRIIGFRLLEILYIDNYGGYFSNYGCL